MWNTTGGFGGDFASGYDGQDGGGAAGGGGFMNSQGQFDSPGGGTKKERKIHNLAATSIRAILESEEPFTIEGVEVHMVYLVGIVRSVEITSTKVCYTIDDHTGVIDVVKYPDGESEDNSQPDALAEGVYARVYGTVRSHQEKKHIIGFNVSQVEDLNVLTSHLLEAIHLKMKMKKLKEAEQGAAAGGSSVLANSSLRSAPEMPGKSGAGGSDKDVVYAAIKSSTSEVGMSKTMIITVLKGKVSAEKIEKAVEELSAEGAIYTTHDDDHFMVIEA